MLGADRDAVIRQTDTYFHTARGRLKLRRTGGGGAELIQYDRPDDPSARWSTYVRIPVQEPDALEGALRRSLGVRSVVRKERTVYLYRTARIHIDEVDGLGTFLEFEIVETPAADAGVLMAELQHAFAVRHEDVCPGSYGEMLGDTEKRGETGRAGA